MGSGCFRNRDDINKVRCLAGIGKLNAQSHSGQAEPDLAASDPSEGRRLTRADELDDWCAQVKKASSIVICSDPELRQQAIIRNKLFEVARARLGPDDYKALNADQSRWVKSYTARCGVSLDGPVPSLPLPQNVIDCYRRESRARTAYLSVRLDITVTLTSPTVSAPAKAGLQQPPAHPSPGETPQNPALERWFHCLWNAVAIRAKQPEPAERVVSAAFGECIGTEEGWRRRSAEEVGGDSPSFEVSLEQFKAETMRAALLEEIASIRAAPFVTASPTAPPPLAAPQKPAGWTAPQATATMAAWDHCLSDAVDVLSQQPEPARTVADAAMGSCAKYELDYKEAETPEMSWERFHEIIAETMVPKVLARVMAIRAARAKLPQEGPKTKPAIDYNRM
jgi:uncharacterized protein YecT (DUF1311 family)